MHFLRTLQSYKEYKNNKAIVQILELKVTLKIYVEHVLLLTKASALCNLKQRQSGCTTSRGASDAVSVRSRILQEHVTFMRWK